jgi:nicotinamidase-related amidase
LDNKAVIIIDVLNDFVAGDLKCERAQHMIPNLTRFIQAARKYKIPVVYGNDAHYERDSEVVHKWGRHAIKGTKGAQVIPELKPTEKDYLVEKRTYSGFYETGLDPLLRSWYGGESVKRLFLEDCTPISALDTLLQALFSEVQNNNSQR